MVTRNTAEIFDSRARVLAFIGEDRSCTLSNERAASSLRSMGQDLTVFFQTNYINSTLH